ncbi:MAG: hypothetical protein K5886_07940 [Lachnospiraceae bacterium]|nr:hypothetical protein [Lachnospiraceae bacterium]
MKKLFAKGLFILLTAGCLTGCGNAFGDDAGKTYVLSDPETGEVTETYSEEEWQKKQEEEEAAKCHHKTLDENGYCTECGEDVGIEIEFDEAEKYFDCTLSDQQDVETNWNNTASGDFTFHITPKSEYKGCRFTNVMITLYGTTDDGTERHLNEDLCTGSIDENGEGYIGSYMYNVYKMNGMKVLSNGSGTTPRIHYGKGTKKADNAQDTKKTVSDTSDSPAASEPVPEPADQPAVKPVQESEDNSDLVPVVIGKDEFDKYFRASNNPSYHTEKTPAGYYAIQSTQDYVGCRFENVDVEVTLKNIKDDYLFDEILSLDHTGMVYRYPDTEIRIDSVKGVYPHDPKAGDPMIYIPKEQYDEIKKYTSAGVKVLEKGDFDKYLTMTLQDNYDPNENGHSYWIEPKPEYKDCRFKNVTIKISGTQDGKYHDELGICGLPEEGTCTVFVGKALNELKSDGLEISEVTILPHNEEDGDPVILFP